MTCYPSCFDLTRFDEEICDRIGRSVGFVDIRRFLSKSLGEIPTDIY